jgi:AraC-like DNA-binding protein
MDRATGRVYISDMAQTAPTAAPPRLPAIEVLIARAEPLHYWHWDQAGMPYWRLYWNDADGARIHADQRVALNPEHLYLVAPHTPTKLRLDRPVGHLYIHFLLAPPYHHPRPGVWAARLGGRLQRTVGGLARQLTQPRTADGADTLRKLGPADLCALLELLGLALGRVPADAWTAHAMDRRVHQAMLRVERRPEQRLTVADLAQEAGLSTAAFARMFRAALGQSPHRYMLRRRVEMAARLLGTGERAIDDIAAACGFCDRYHFTRVFRRHHGMGPAQFRHQQPSLPQL